MSILSACKRAAIVTPNPPGLSIASGPVFWDNLTNFSAVSDALTKTSATTAFDAYATSNTKYSGAQKLIFTFPNAVVHSQVGLTDSSTTDIGGGLNDHARYGIYFDKNNGYIYVEEYGTTPMPGGTPVGTVTASPTDTWEINVSASGTVTYKKNGTVIYTSALSAAGLQLYPSAVAYNVGAAVSTAVWTRGSNL